MNREQIEAEWLVWRETGKMHDAMFDFAQHIAKLERNACEQIAMEWDVSHSETNYGYCIANAIRARGDE